MRLTHYLRSGAQWLAAGAGLGAFAYLGYAGTTWLRCGHAKQPPAKDETDLLLDRFMPQYEVAERHHVRVAAPADVTMSAAIDLDLSESAIIRTIFKTRELVLRARRSGTPGPTALLAQMKTLGWGVLAEIPGQEIVMGGVTQPWMDNVVIRALPPDQFAAFCEPGYVKIAWTLRVDSIGSAESVARTETRVVTTDAVARTKFRRYWSFFLPGILLIRRVSLWLGKKRSRARRLDWRSGGLHSCPLAISRS